MYTQALTCVKTSPFFFVSKGKESRRPPHEGFSGTKPFTDKGIYNTCFLLLRRKPVPGVRIVECTAREESEKHTLPHPLVVFFCSHLFALSPRSERLEQATTQTASDRPSFLRAMRGEWKRKIMQINGKRDERFLRSGSRTRSSRLRRSPLTRVLDLLWVKKNKRLLAV